MSQQERKKVTQAAGVVGLATLLSRVFGFLRDMAIAYLFGAGPAADAFFVAFRIPNLLRRLFAEGALTIAFIPIFTEVLLQKGLEEARALARSTSGLLCLALVVICALGMIFAQEVLSVIAPGFQPGSQTYGLAVTLTRFCFPYIFFISLAALSSGILNSREHFLSPAISPVLLNISLICCALGLNLDPPVLSLGIGVLAGGAAQLFIQLPYLKSKGMSILPGFHFNNPHLKKVITLMLPAAFGAAIYQITVLVNTILASFLPSGSVSYLYYADRLVEFPLGIFAVALGTAVLPSLSRQAVAGNYDDFIATANYGLRLTMFICLPAMVGLILLAEPIVSVFFGRGRFGAQDVSATALALWGYGIGLWAFAGLRALLPAFYALKDTKTPVKVGVIVLIINIIAGLILMRIWQHVGLALATSISSAANFTILLYLLRRKLGYIGFKKIIKSALGSLLACLLMGGAVTGGLLLIGRYHDWQQASHLTSAMYIILLVIVGAGVYLLAARALRLPEVNELTQMLKRKKKLTQ